MGYAMSLCTLILCPDDLERQVLLRERAARFGVCHVTYCKVEETPFESIVEQLSTPLLFGTQTIICDGIEQLKKAELERLATCLARPLPDMAVLLGSKSGKIPPLPRTEVVDLASEKPWERERRLQLVLINEAKKRGKTLSSSAAAALLQRIGPDWGSLHNELSKLLCFVGIRAEITERDIDAIASRADRGTDWQRVEAFVWDGIFFKPQSTSGELLSTIPLIRYHLTIGAQICALQATGHALDLARYLPQLRPKSLEKYVQSAARKPPHFFRSAQGALFTLELAAKRGQGSPEVLWTRFAAELLG